MHGGFAWPRANSERLRMLLRCHSFQGERLPRLRAALMNGLPLDLAWQGLGGPNSLVQHAIFIIYRYSPL